MVSKQAYLVSDPKDIGDPAGVILPGVGDFGACMDALDERGFKSVVLDLIAAKTPLLGVCVGMQMLFEFSEESGGHAGLGLLPGKVTKLRGARRLPQMQWNTLDLPKDSGGLYVGIAERPWVYFVHSYAITSSEFATATCDYGENFVASVQSGNVFGTQYHPEKSSKAGLSIIANFVSIAEGRAFETDTGN